MSWRRRFVNLFRRRRIEREIDEELSFHIEELTDSLIASGFSRTEARREALRRFGNYELKREHTREANTIQWIESLWRDLRFAARTYIRTPVFSGVVTAVLAITIAVSTAVFSIYSHLALQTVDGVQGANRLVSIGLAREANEWIPFSRDQYLFIAEALSVPETLITTSHSYQRIVEYGPSTH